MSCNCWLDMATLYAGRPWSPCAILREAQKIDGKVFAQLTEQVIGRWIVPVVKARGFLQWSDSVLAQAATGNSPGVQEMGHWEDVQIDREAPLENNVCRVEGAHCF